MAAGCWNYLTLSSVLYKLRRFATGNYIVNPSIFPLQRNHILFPPAELHSLFSIRFLDSYLSIGSNGHDHIFIDGTNDVHLLGEHTELHFDFTETKHASSLDFTLHPNNLTVTVHLGQKTKIIAVQRLQRLERIIVSTFSEKQHEIDLKSSTNDSTLRFTVYSGTVKDIVQLVGKSFKFRTHVTSFSGAVTGCNSTCIGDTSIDGTIDCTPGSFNLDVVDGTLDIGDSVSAHIIAQNIDINCSNIGDCIIANAAVFEADRVDLQAESHGSTAVRISSAVLFDASQVFITTLTSPESVIFGGTMIGGTGELVITTENAHVTISPTAIIDVDILQILATSNTNRMIVHIASDEVITATSVSVVGNNTRSSGLGVVINADMNFSFGTFYGEVSNERAVFVEPGVVMGGTGNLSIAAHSRDSGMTNVAIMTMAGDISNFTSVSFSISGTAGGVSGNIGLEKLGVISNVGNLLIEYTAHLLHEGVGVFIFGETSCANLNLVMQGALFRDNSTGIEFSDSVISITGEASIHSLPLFNGVGIRVSGSSEFRGPSLVMIGDSESQGILFSSGEIRVTDNVLISGISTAADVAGVEIQSLNLVQDSERPSVVITGDNVQTAGTSTSGIKINNLSSFGIGGIEMTLTGTGGVNEILLESPLSITTDGTIVLNGKITGNQTITLAEHTRAIGDLLVSFNGEVDSPQLDFYGGRDGEISFSAPFPTVNRVNSFTTYGAAANFYDTALFSDTFDIHTNDLSILGDSLISSPNQGNIGATIQGPGSLTIDSDVTISSRTGMQNPLQNLILNKQVLFGPAVTLVNTSSSIELNGSPQYVEIQSDLIFESPSITVSSVLKGGSLDVAHFIGTVSFGPEVHEIEFCELTGDATFQATEFSVSHEFYAHPGSIVRVFNGTFGSLTLHNATLFPYSDNTATITNQMSFVNTGGAYRVLSGADPGTFFGKTLGSAVDLGNDIASLEISMFEQLPLDVEYRIIEADSIQGSFLGLTGSRQFIQVDNDTLLFTFNTTSSPQYVSLTRVVAVPHSPILSPSPSPSSPSISPSSPSISPSSPSISPSSPSISPSSPSISPSSPSISPSGSTSQSPSISLSNTPTSSRSYTPSRSRSCSTSFSHSITPSSLPSMTPSLSHSFTLSLSPSSSSSSSPSKSRTPSKAKLPSAAISPSLSVSTSMSITISPSALFSITTNDTQPLETVTNLRSISRSMNLPPLPSITVLILPVPSDTIPGALPSVRPTRTAAQGCRDCTTIEHNQPLDGGPTFIPLVDDDGQPIGSVNLPAISGADEIQIVISSTVPTTPSGTVIMDIAIFDVIGNELTNFPGQTIEICLAETVAGVDDNTCLGFFNILTNRWECESVCLRNEGDMYCGGTDHLTSFALLLEGASGISCNSGDISYSLAWASFALVIAAIITVLLSMVAIEAKYMWQRRKENDLFNNVEVVMAKSQAV